MEQDKCEFCTSKYHEQGLAFAPLAANTIGQQGSELLRFLWALADHAARNYVPVPVTVLPVLSDAPSSEDHNSPQVVRFKRQRGQLFVVGVPFAPAHRVYEAITHRGYGRASSSQSQAQYWETLSSLSLLWSPQSPPSSQPPAAQGPSPSLPLAAPPIVGDRGQMEKCGQGCDGARVEGCAKGNGTNHQPPTRSVAAATCFFAAPVAGR
jgi:hypothetical protein